jgi:hypothetical protein
MPHTESRADSENAFWTVQQFWTGPTGQPWYALQKQSDEGVLQQFTGYPHEIDDLCRMLGIIPEELPATTEDEDKWPFAATDRPRFYS